MGCLSALHTRIPAHLLFPYLAWSMKSSLLCAFFLSPMFLNGGVRWGAGGRTRVPLSLYKLCTHRTQLQETPPSVGESSVDLLTSLFTDLSGVSIYVQVLKAQRWKDCKHPHGQRHVGLTDRGISMSSTVPGTR